MAHHYIHCVSSSSSSSSSSNSLSAFLVVLFPDGEAKKPRLAFLQCELLRGRGGCERESLKAAAGWGATSLLVRLGLAVRLADRWARTRGSRVQSCGQCGELRRDAKHEDACFISQDKEAREQLSETASTWKHLKVPCKGRIECHHFIATVAVPPS